MAHTEFHAPREVVAEALRADGPSLLHKPKRLTSYIKTYCNTELSPALDLVSQLDRELLEPLAYLDSSKSGDTVDVAALRDVRIQIADILEEEREVTSEISLEIADALVGGYADYAGVALLDVRTPRQKKPHRLSRPSKSKPAKTKKHEKDVEHGDSTRPKLSSRIPLVPLIVFACVTVVLVVAGIVLVTNSQPKPDEELPTTPDQGMWVVSRTTYEESNPYDEDSAYRVTSEFAHDEHGNVTSVHQEGGWSYEEPTSKDVTFEVGKDGLIQFAHTQDTQEVETYDEETGELLETEEDVVEDYEYLWEFDDMGHAISASVRQPPQYRLIVEYAYNDIGMIKQRAVKVKYGGTPISERTYTYYESGFPQREEEHVYEDGYTVDLEKTYKYTKDAEGRPDSCTISSSDGTIVSESYRYDANGNVSECIVEDEENGTTRTTTYEYEYVEKPSLWARQSQHVFPTLNIERWL